MSASPTAAMGTSIDAILEYEPLPELASALGRSLPGTRLSSGSPKGQVSEGKQNEVECFRIAGH